MSTFQVTREDDFDFRSPEYARLFQRSEATAFQHPLWLHHLYAVLAPHVGASRLVVTIRRPDGSLAGVLPLVQRRRLGLRTVEYADLGVNDYAAAVVDRDVVDTARSDGQIGPAVRQALGPFDLLRIERAADTAEVLVSLIGGAQVKRHNYQTHVVALPESSQAWSEGLRPDFARHLERKYKRLRPKGPRQIRIITDPAESRRVMEQLREFRAARFGERGGVDLMQVPEYFAFYRTVAGIDDPDSPGRLAVLEVADRVVAVAFDLDHNDRELFLLVGYDVEKLRNYSLGLLIVDELARAAIARGRRQFDLTVGDEPYKADFGAVPQPLFELRIARTPLGALGLLGRDVYLRSRKQAKTWRSAWQERRRAAASAGQTQG